MLGRKVLTLTALSKTYMLPCRDAEPIDARSSFDRIINFLCGPQASVSDIRTDACIMICDK